MVRKDYRKENSCEINKKAKGPSFGVRVGQGLGLFWPSEFLKRLGPNRLSSSPKRNSKRCTAGRKSNSRCMI